MHASDEILILPLTLLGVLVAGPVFLASLIAFLVRRFGREKRRSAGTIALLLVSGAIGGFSSYVLLSPDLWYNATNPPDWDRERRIALAVWAVPAFGALVGAVLPARPS